MAGQSATTSTDVHGDEMTNAEIWYLIRLAEWETGFDTFGRPTRMTEKPEPPKGGGQ
jgi:hypothetical protein